MPEKLQKLVFKIHINVNIEWKRPFKQQGTSSCKCRKFLLRTIRSEIKKNRGELNNKKKDKHKHAQVVLLKIYKFSCFHNFHFK